MRDYNGFSYRPDYGYELYRDGRLVEREDRVRYAACFAAVFRQFYGRNDMVFEGTYKLRCRKEFVRESGNFCALTKEEILKILRYMRRVFDMKARMVETKDNYVFTFRIVGKPIKHKFILTFSRVFYEFPYNELARDVFRLRAKGIVDGIDYSHKSFLELYHVITASYTGGLGNGHSLFCYPTLEISNKVLNKAFEKGVARVHYVHSESRDAYDRMDRVGTGYRTDWDKRIDARIIRYSENFQILRKLKTNEKGVRRRARKVV